MEKFKLFITPGFHVLIVVITIIFCGFMFYVPYNDMKIKSIESLNDRQLVLAKQAGNSISSFFNHYKNTLSHLSKLPQIITMNKEGKDILKKFYDAHKEEISAITRVDPVGKIIFTIPYNKNAVGVDISNQEHNRFIIDNHKPIVSDVFEAVQGYRTVAFAYPVMKDNKYIGSLSILIPFNHIAEKFMSDIKIGEEGYAWMISKKGVVLYSPIMDHTGKTIIETLSRFPSVIKMTKKMMEGKEGKTSYKFSKARDRKTEMPIIHAAYTSIKLPNTYWSIAVATPEKQIVKTLVNFRDKWLMINLLMGFGMIFYFYYSLTKWTELNKDRVQKKAQKTLQRTRALYSTVLNNLSDMVFITDLNGIVTYINSTAAAHYDIPEKIEVEIPLCFFWCGESIIKIEAGLKTVKSTLDTSFIECVCGDELYELSLTPLFDDNILSSIVCVGRNITERTKTRGIMIQTEKMMTVGGLAAGMAHEINNPLGIILQGVQVALNRLSPDIDKNRQAAAEIGIDIESINEYLKKRKILNYMDNIQDAAKRAAKIISNMIQFSRIGGTNRTTVNINQVIDDTIDLASNDYNLVKKFDFKNITINKNYKQNLSAVNCVDTEIEQVILNLLNNSSHALAEVKSENFKPEITIRTDMEKDFLVIEISDNGPGMNEGILRRIFEPFYTTKDVGTGTGLGLSVSYFIITNNHNGLIEVESKPGMGAKFTIKLPVGNS